MDVGTSGEFQHHMTDVGNGVQLHSVMGGSGHPLFLLHGFPQTWQEWRHVMGRLAERFTVVAVDLKGGGQSSKPATGYDKVTMAGELDALRQELGFDTVSVVGHDFGGMVAYAWAANFRESVDRLAVIDVLLPGAREWDTALLSPPMWHFSFHQEPDLPELLIAGRETAYVETMIRERMYNQGAMTADDIAVWAAALAQPGAARGMLGWYRALPQDVIDNRRFALDRLRIPVLGVGGDRRWGDRIGDVLAEFADDVTAHSIRDCGHWVAEERPGELLDVLLPFLEA